MNFDKNTIYTIGYAPLTLDTFVTILEKHQISAVVDVRSSPYSKFKPEFNKKTLKDYLNAHKIAYVFLGDYCGARVDDPSCYVNGKVDYEIVAKSKKFKDGLERIKKGMENYRIIIMCAEKDPITCHRTILICRNLRSDGIKIKHILGNADVEEQKDSEFRLMKLFKLHHPDLFRTEEQRIDDAYTRQGEKIAYKTPVIANEHWG